MAALTYPAILRDRIRTNLLSMPQRKTLDPSCIRLFRRNVTESAVSFLGYRNPVDFVDQMRERVATVTFLAGAGSRWTKSIPPSINPSLPRCLAQVEDVTGPPGAKIPIGVYNLRAVKGIGKPFIVWGTHKELIEQMALQAGMADAVLVPQLKPIGHGDAMKGVLPLLGKNIHYVITNFGGDANSNETIVASLAVLAALQAFGDKERPSGLLPTAFLDEAKYPINLDSEGDPVSFGHPRLKEGQQAVPVSGHSNVGVRLYEREGLSSAVAYFMQYFRGTDAGYAIPGNKEATFGLDNIDDHLAGERKLQLACFAQKEEIISSVKQFGDIPGFLSAMRIILSNGK